MMLDGNTAALRQHEAQQDRLERFAPSERQRADWIAERVHTLLTTEEYDVAEIVGEGLAAQPHGFVEVCMSIASGDLLQAGERLARAVNAYATRLAEIDWDVYGESEVSTANAAPPCRCRGEYCTC